MLSNVIQSVWVAVISMPPRRGGPAAAVGLGCGVGATATGAPVGAAAGVGPVLTGGAASGARRAQAANPKVAIEPTNPPSTCRRVTVRMRLSFPHYVCWSSVRHSHVGADVGRAPGASHR